jgi:enoyl-CoA hydratase/carnithine racemase
MEDVMEFISIDKHDGIATVKLERGKVNALNGMVIGELNDAFKSLETDGSVRSVILTGSGGFFSFGFDIPEFLDYTKEQFTNYLKGFAAFYTYLFLYPKPVIAALNGHTIAGACMIALACDYRVMVSGSAKISLNEIAFGSSVFAGSTEMLRFWCGNANATKVLYSGDMFKSDKALELGLIDEATSIGELMPRSINRALELAGKTPYAFASIKKLLRKNIAEAMERDEPASIKEFVDIWYSDATRENLKNIRIR